PACTEGSGPRGQHSSSLSVPTLAHTQPRLFSGTHQISNAFPIRRVPMSESQPQSKNTVHFAGENTLLEQYRDDEGQLMFALKVGKAGDIKTEVREHAVSGISMSPLSDTYIARKGVVLPPAPHGDPQTTET